jgi:pimeloyl-ACP methyl ester carboxylesterase
VFIYLRKEDFAEDVSFRDFFNRFDDRTGMVHHVVRDHAVVMIHGIMTEGLWFATTAKALKDADHSLHPVPAGYGHFDLVRFLAPIPYFRRAVVRRIQSKLRGVVEDSKIRRVSVIAHSFGTFVIGEILKTSPDLRLHRLILCGSILPEDYDWETHSHKIDPLSGDATTQRIVNDCGWRDVWPVFAESVTWGYGSAGRFGFQGPKVLDRFHGTAHSDFFGDAFVHDYWLPLLSEGRVVDGPQGRPMATWWIRVLRTFKLRWLIVVGTAIGLALLLFKER